MSDYSHGKVNILPIVAVVLLCLCLLSFWRVGSVYGKLTDEEVTPSEFMTESDASRYYEHETSGSSKVETIEVESTIIEIPEPEPREGYEFLGWNTCNDGSGGWYYPGELFEMTEECTDFYAIWEKIEKLLPPDAALIATISDAIPAGGNATATVTTEQPAEEAVVPESEEAASEGSETVEEITDLTEITDVIDITEVEETEAGALDDKVTTETKEETEPGSEEKEAVDSQEETEDASAELEEISDEPETESFEPVETALESTEEQPLEEAEVKSEGDTESQKTE